MKNNFILFGGDFYYPGGGLRDFIGSYETISEMNMAAAEINNRYDWMRGLDVSTMTEIAVGVKISK